MLSRIASHLLLLSSVGLPFTLRRSAQGDLQKIRAKSRAAILQRYPAWARLPLGVWMCVTWPISTILSTVLLPMGVPFGQKLCLLYRGLLQNAHPAELDKAQPSKETIYSTDLLGLYSWLNGRDCSEWVSDKWRFAAFCSENGINHPETQLANTPTVEPQHTYIIKPRRKSGGRGVRRLMGKEVAHAQFDDGHIIQPEIKAQPGAVWKDLSRAALELRIVTAKSASGQAMGIAAIWWLSDHSATGAVDLETGELMDAPFDHTLDGFDAVLDQCKSLHAAHGDLVILGWDVLYDGAQFYVLEVNQQQSLKHLEDVTGTPLIAEKLVPLFAEYL